MIEPPTKVRRSGLVVPMPEVEELVGAHRRKWDPVAERGAAAHVTVLFPFAAPDPADEEMLGRIRRALAPCASFAVTFADVRSFPDHVLYLAPEPASAFRGLTETLAAAFPEFPPYDGQFADVIPHLTLTHRPDAPVEEVAAAIRPHLPAAARAGRVELWEEGLDDRWTTRASFPLTDDRT